MLKNFLQAGFGGFFSQVIVFLSLPFITRLYTPATYATWAIVMATAGILGAVACFRYELAIVTSNDENDASSIFWGCIISSLLVGIIIFGSYFIFAHQSYFNIGRIKFNLLHHFIFISLMAALMGIGATLQYWNTRHKSFFHNSIALVASSCITVIIQLLWAFKISPSPYGLLLGSIGGLLTAIIFQLSAIFLTKTIPALNLTIIRRIFVCLKQQRRFLQYSTPYALFGVIRDRATILVMEMFLPMQAVGLYALAYRVMNFPVTLVSNALRPVFFQACSSQGVKAIESQLNKIMKWLVVLAMPCMVFYFYFANDLFTLFFGPQWQGAGHIGKFLIFPVVTFLLVNWMDRIMDVLGEQKLTLLLEITFSTLSIFGLWLGFFLQLGLTGALLIQCSVLVLYNIVYLMIAYGKANYNRIKLFKLMPSALVISGITVFTLEILKMIF